MTLHLECGVRGLEGNTANTFTSSSSVSGDVHVSLVSPIGSPRVSNLPEVLSLLVSISNDGDSVIELGSAFFVIDNSSLVELEDLSVGLNRNGDHSIRDSDLKLIIIIWGNVSIPINLESLLGRLGFA